MSQRIASHPPRDLRVVVPERREVQVRRRIPIMSGVEVSRVYASVEELLPVGGVAVTTDQGLALVVNPRVEPKWS